MKIKSFSTKKKAAITALVCILVFAVAFGVYVVFLRPDKEPVIVYEQQQSVIDVDDPREMAGFADFVFVGRVEKQDGTKYEAVHTRDDGSSSGVPYTGYDIAVLKNIKGNLKTNETMRFWKSGGLTMSKKYISLQEGDALPAVGGVYMFYATVWEDGSLRVLGTNGNILLTDTTLTEKAAAEMDKIEDSSIYQELVKACKNEVPYECERFTLPADMLE